MDFREKGLRDCQRFLKKSQETVKIQTKVGAMGTESSRWVRVEGRAERGERCVNEPMLRSWRLLDPAPL